jgi:hypothetical protein
MILNFYFKKFWKAYHVKRLSNEAAHRLVKLALTMCEERLWR